MGAWTGFSVERLPPGRLRLVLCLYLLAIYASLPFARPVLNLLHREAAGPFSVGSYVLIGGAAALVLRWARGRWPIALGLLGLLGLALPRIPLPEERLHFLEYGLLGFFLPLALRDRRGAMGASAVLVLAAGVVDELIQWALPGRVGELRDVLFLSLIHI